MSFRVRFSNRATKYSRSLDEHVRMRLKKKLAEVARDPFRYLDHYEGQGHKLKIGDFRAIVDVDSTARTLFIRLFDKRGRVYKQKRHQ